MATFIPLTNLIQQYVDTSGDVLVNGSLEFFLAGGVITTELFSDNVGTSIGTSITLNSFGMPESGGNTIGLFRDQSKALKVVLKNAAGATIYTFDNIPAVASFDTASSTKLDFITVTQAVDLDTMESAIDDAYKRDGTVTLTGDLNFGAGVFVALSATSGITASITQSQGNGLLTSAINEISVVTNTNDTVTLPVAKTGRQCIVINNGINTLQIFPSSGNFIGVLAVDLSTTALTGDRITFTAYNATTWNAT